MHSTCRRFVAFAFVCFVGGLIANVACADPGPAAGRWVGDFRAGDFLGSVLDLHVHDGRLYAAGGFDAVNGEPLRGVVRLNDTSWESVGNEQVAWVSRLASFDASLVAAGRFILDSGEPVDGIATWDGSRWNVASQTISVEFVQAMIELDGQLYIAAMDVFGDGGFALNPILRWDGKRFDRLPSTGTWVFDLVEFGGSLYAGGGNGVVRWTGEMWESTGFPWSTVNSLVVHEGTLYAATTAWNLNENAVWALRNGTWEPVPSITIDEGIGRLISTTAGLLAVGNFSSIDSVPAQGVALWDGTRWSALGAGLWPSANDAMEFNGVLYAAGSLNGSGSVRMNSVARWSGASWARLNPSGNGLTATAAATTVHDQQLVVVGDAGGYGACAGRSAACWDGINWKLLNSDPNVQLGQVVGTGSGIYASGTFAMPGPYIKHIPLLRRIGNLWEALSVYGGVEGYVHRLIADGDEVVLLGDLRIPWLHDGSGPTTANITRFSYSQGWSKLGSANGSVRTGVVLQQGLVVGGEFSNIDGQSVRRVAMLTPLGWQEFAGGIDDDIPTSMVYSAGKLYVACEYSVRVWNGSHWTIHGRTYADTNTLCVYDTRVYVAGFHTPVQEITDEALVPIPGSPDGAISHLVVYDDGNGPSMFVLGQFAFADGQPAAHIAQFNSGTCRADANRDHKIDGVDLAVLLSSYGKRTSNPYEAADFTGDARVNADDLTILLGRFGDSCK